MPTVSTPTFSPVAGTYNGIQHVIISTTTAGSTIYYTTDGTNPTISSALYSTPVLVDQSITVKALAVHSGFTDSAVGSAAYVLNKVCAFVDPSGAPIANGTMVVSLNADAMASIGQLISRNTTFSLDSNGVVDASAMQLLSSLSNNYDSNNAPSYSVTVYSSSGERVWGPGIPNNPALPSTFQ